MRHASVWLVPSSSCKPRRSKKGREERSTSARASCKCSQWRGFRGTPHLTKATAFWKDLSQIPKLSSPIRESIGPVWLSIMSVIDRLTYVSRLLYPHIVATRDTIRTSLDIPVQFHDRLHEAARRRGCSARQLLLGYIERLLTRRNAPPAAAGSSPARSRRRPRRDH